MRTRRTTEGRYDEKKGPRLAVRGFFFLYYISLTPFLKVLTENVYDEDDRGPVRREKRP